jgi:hypothetical protein
MPYDVARFFDLQQNIDRPVDPPRMGLSRRLAEAPKNQPKRFTFEVQRSFSPTIE